MTKRLFVVDAMAMAFRSFYAFGMRPLTTASGMPTSAIFGAAMFMNKLISEQKPDYLLVATDSIEPTFRHELYPNYKAHRKEMPPDLAAQLPHFFKLFEAYGLKLLKQAGLEADDLIGSLAHQYAGNHNGEELQVCIVSGDKDFMQLVNSHICLYRPKKGEDAEIIDREGVHAKFGCWPEQVIDCLAIIGDTSDNIPGVHGIGEKGAAKLIETYGNLDSIYEHVDEITNKKQREALKACRDKAYLSRTLATIKTDIPLKLNLDDIRLDVKRALANENLLNLFRELEFRSLSTKVSNALGVPDSGEVVKKDPKITTFNGEGGKGQGELSFATFTIEEQKNSRAHEVAPVRASAPLRSGLEVEGAFDRYHLVNTPLAWQQLAARLAKAKVYAIDTETTGLSIIDDRPIGFSIALDDGQPVGEAFYVPLIEKHLEGLKAEQIIADLKAIVEKPDTLKIGHNLKFDLQMFENIGIHITGRFSDTMICDYLLDSTSRQHGLDASCARHLHYRKIPTATLIGERGQFSMADAPLEQLSRYACEDADFTLRLYRKLLPQIEANGLSKVLNEIEMPLIPVLAKMEREGIYIDAEELDRFSTRLSDMAKALEIQIYELAGGPFNINSPKQLQELLFVQLKVHEKLKVKSIKKTKTGFSTDESVLSKLTGHPLPKLLLDYRSVMKLKSTYVDALPQLISPTTNRLHTSFHQTGTTTGRLSSSDPNLQNIPIRSALGQEIRKAFKPQKPGYVLISADYSQIELRLLGHIAKEAALTQAFRENQDIHTMTASRIFDVPPDKVDATLRSRAKAINFGIIYGMGARRLAQETGVSMAQAQEFIERYFITYPGIQNYVNDSIKEARANGFTTTITGRRRPIPELLESSPRVQANAENIAVNSPIQGSAADLIKLAMIRTHDQFEKKGVKARMLLQVHDELVFECPEQEIDSVTAIIRDSMEHAMNLSVPLAVEIGHGQNWLEAH